MPAYDYIWLLKLGLSGESALALVNRTSHMYPTLSISGSSNAGAGANECAHGLIVKDMYGVDETGPRV